MTDKVIVYGGMGGLGRAVIKMFKDAGFWVLCIDPAGATAEADGNIQVILSQTWTEQEEDVCRGVDQQLAGAKAVAVINVAGGWAGGNSADKNWVKAADLMWKQSVWSSSIAATLASRFLAPGGLLVLPGAQPCLGGTPGMMGYGMAKAAVHQLVKSLGMPGSGLPPDTCTLAILPITLDTPQNRQNMPDADTSTWTPLAELAYKLAVWTKKPAERPVPGSLVTVATKDNKTTFTVAE